MKPKDVKYLWELVEKRFLEMHEKTSPWMAILESDKFKSPNRRKRSKAVKKRKGTK